MYRKNSTRLALRGQSLFGSITWSFYFTVFHFSFLMTKKSNVNLFLLTPVSKKLRIFLNSYSIISRLLDILKNIMYYVPVYHSQTHFVKTKNLSASIINKKIQYM